MPEDGHVGQGHLNCVSLVWTIPSSQMLLSDWLQVNWGTDTVLENSQIRHTALRSQFCCFYRQLRVTATLRQHCDNKHWWSSDYSVQSHLSGADEAWQTGAISALGCLVHPTVTHNTCFLPSLRTSTLCTGPPIAPNRNLTGLVLPADGERLFLPP